MQAAAKAEKEVESYANAIGLGGDMPVLVAKLEAATARVESLRASLAAQETLADQAAMLDPEDLVEALRLTQDGTPDLSADRKVLRSMGVQITVDKSLKEAIITGNLAKVVAGQLSMSSVPTATAGRTS